MKHSFYSFIFALILGLFCINASAQTFSKMPEKQRNEALIKEARKFYKNPNFKSYYKKYGEHGTPEVTSFVVQDKNTRPAYANHHYVGKLQYKVSFWWKTSVKGEKLSSAIVYVSDELGEAWYINFSVDSNAIVTRWIHYNIFE